MDRSEARVQSGARAGSRVSESGRRNVRSLSVANADGAAPMAKAPGAQVEARAIRWHDYTVHVLGAATILVASVGAVAELERDLPLRFTPAHAAVAGGVLGLSTVLKLVGNGRVLGVSGTVSGMLNGGHRDVWRSVFLLGMSFGGLASVKLLGLTDAFQVLPATFGAARAVGAGLLVGAGSVLGKGCTSGHGLCGNSRLSPRSMVQTVLSMAAGIATATLTNTLGALGVPSTASRTPLYLPSAAGEVMPALVLLGLSGVTAATVYLTGKNSRGVAACESDKVKAPRDDAENPYEKLVEFASGALFSVGLAMTGMTRSKKVAGFLSLFHPAWDATLMFVMGGALLVSLPATLKVIGSGSKPAFRKLMEIPTRVDIDWKLVLGGVLFGAGWGLGGLCPGPAIVNAVVVPGKTIGYFMGSMLGGMWLAGRFESLWSRFTARRAAKKAAKKAQ